MQKLKIIGTILFTILLWHIGLWDPVNIPFPFNTVDLPGQFYHDLIVPNKIEIGFSAGVLVLLIQLLNFKNPFKLKRKKILNAIQNHYIKDQFDGEFEKHRITIFKTQLGLFLYHKYIWKCLMINRKKHKSKGLIKFYRWHNFPKPFRYYLVQFSRNGHPFPKGSSSMFLAPNNKSEITSIVSESYYKESPRNVSLPKLDSDKIESISNFNRYKGNKKTIIKQYMTKGRIDSFDRLKSLHRYPTRLYADPIILQDEKKWGCIVFDSIADTDSFDKSFQDFVSYSKIIQSVISNLN